ncbi:ribose transport system permease protein [Paracoccus isoporae]|uniref:Ribose transport system permease protein n=1 Tax=Paracoccus isoporae TaxID=591205 RepID=A0A1G7H3V5_9RHOB|nr:ABC transporter permease [Paracoccus isoporae]SDE94964.1 ribose transport system permease protein [Paracoccus isoporae]
MTSVMHEDGPRGAAGMKRNGNASMRRLIAEGAKGPIGLVAALVVLIVVFSFLNPRFASIENLQNVLFQVSVPLILVVGATLVIQMGSIDLSVEGIMGAAGMAWILLSPNTRTMIDLGMWAWLIALGLGLSLGLMTGVIYAKLKVPSFVVSLGTWYVGLGIAILLYGNNSLPSLTSDALARWPTGLTLGLPHSFWLAAGVLLFGLLISNYTNLGRGLMAIGNNEPIARTSGMPVNVYKIGAFAIAGLLGGLAGILATMQLGSGSTDIGFGQLFVGIPAAVIGGTALGGGEGGMTRSALGVFLLIILNNGLVLAGVDPDYQSGVFGLILLIAIIAVAWPERGRLKVAK